MIEEDFIKTKGILDRLNNLKTAKARMLINFSQNEFNDTIEVPNITEIKDVALSCISNEIKRLTEEFDKL